MKYTAIAALFGYTQAMVDFILEDPSSTTTLTSSTPTLGVSQDDEVAFNQWIARHGHSYKTNEEYNFRMNTFAVNIGKVNRFNA